METNSPFDQVGPEATPNEEIFCGLVPKSVSPTNFIMDSFSSEFLGLTLLTNLDQLITSIIFLKFV